MHSQPSSDDYRRSIGRTVEVEDVVTAQMVRRYLACLAPSEAADIAGDVPPGLHWCLAPDAAPMSALGADGHAVKGGFMPNVPLPRRMWAGGELEIVAPIRVGDTVVRRSRIASVNMKEGRSGPLCFVAVEHEVTTSAGLAIRERQDVVYRDAQQHPTEVAAPSADAGAARTGDDLTWDLDTSPVLLFRYSALTFNGHRIHYDQPYATGVEGYEGLVVHGPLQATLLLNAAARLGAGPPRRFSYRGVRALIAGAPAQVCARRSAAGEVQCEVRDATGQVTMKATATW